VVRSSEECLSVPSLWNLMRAVRKLVKGVTGPMITCLQSAFLTIKMLTDRDVTHT